MKKSFRPEFLNRIDEQIMFTPLSEESIHRIVKIQLHNIIKRMNASNIRLEFSDALIKHIAEIGYDPVFGARPVNRVIQQQVMNPLSKEILAGNVSVNDSILLDYNNGVMISKQSTGELA
jgi:ATP-dependent Clp protease ATP-binding subunit ClpB